MSLFSVFDPVALWGMSVNWLSMMMVIFFVPLVIFYVGGKGKVVMGSVILKVGVVLKEVSYPSFLGIVMLSVSLFLFISINNGLGLFPFVFTGTSHLVVTLSMGLVLWMSFFFMGWIEEFKKSSSHLTPEGSPLGLAPFLVIVELISHLIRPVTLSVRLAANMMAGHLIIGLLASMSEFSFVSFFVSVFFQSFVLVLEWAVAFIQAFVFSVLVMLYALEYY